MKGLSLLAGGKTIPLKRVEKPAPAPTADQLRIAELEKELAQARKDCDAERAAKESMKADLQAAAVSRTELQGVIDKDAAVLKRCEGEVADLRKRLNEAVKAYASAMDREQSEAVGRAKAEARCTGLEESLRIANEALQAERKKKAPREMLAPAPTTAPDGLEVVVERNELDQVVRMHVKRKGE